MLDLGKLRNKTRFLLDKWLDGMSQNIGKISLHAMLLLKFSLERANGLLILLEEAHSDDDLKPLLTSFLRTTWQQSKNHSLCYTAHPKSEMTALMLDVADALALSDLALKPEFGEGQPNRKAKLLELTINYLMPGIYFECDTVPPYAGGSWNDVTAKQLLATHILKEGGDYLVPILSLCAINRSESGLPTLENPHAILPEKESDCFLSDREVRRLAEHSPLTMALISAKQSFDDLSSRNSSHLLGQLNHLIKALRVNSKEGRGTEHVAGQGGELAIRTFVDYFKALSSDIKARLPEILITEIRLLHLCIADKALGELKSFSLIDTCFATRRCSLENAIKGNEILLSQCSLSDSQENQQIQSAISVLKQSTKDLISEVKQGEVSQASDKLPLSKSKLERFNLQLTASTFDELLFILKPLACDDIPLFFDNDKAIENFFRVIENINNFIVLSLELSDEQFRELIKITPQSFFNEKTMLQLLALLNEEKTNIIFDGYLLTKHSDMLTSSEFLFGFYPGLLKSSNQRAKDLFYNYLNSSERLFKDFLSHINSVYRLNDFFISLPEDKIEGMYTLLEEKILSMVSSNIDQLDKFVLNFPESKQVWLLEKLSGEIEKNDYKELIFYCLKYLNADASNLVFQTFKQNILLSVETFFDLYLAALALSIEQLQELTTFLAKPLISTIVEPFPITTWHYYRSGVLSYPDFLIGSKLQNLLINSNDYYFHLCNKIEREKFNLIFKALGNFQIPCMHKAINLITIFNSFHETLKLSSDSRQTEALNSVINFIDFACADGETLATYLPGLSAEGQKILLELVINKHGNLINNGIQFGKIFQSLYDDSETYFLCKLKFKILSSLKSGERLSDAFSYLDEQKQVRLTDFLLQLFDVNHEKINECDLMSMLMAHPLVFNESQAFLLAAIKQNSHAFVYTSMKLKKNKRFVFSAMSTNSRVLPFLLDEFKQGRGRSYLSLIDTGEDLALALKDLKGESFENAQVLVADKWPNILKCENDFYTFFALCRHMDLFYFRMTLISMKPMLLTLDGDSLAKVIQLLSYQQVQTLFEECMNEMLSVIADSAQLGAVLKELSNIHDGNVHITGNGALCLILFDRAIEQLAIILKNGDDLKLAFSGMDSRNVDLAQFVIEDNGNLFYNANCDLMSMLKYFLKEDVDSDYMDDPFALLAIKQNAAAYKCITNEASQSLSFAKKALKMNAGVQDYFSEGIKNALGNEPQPSFSLKQNISRFFSNVTQAKEGHEADSDEQPAFQPGAGS